MARSNPELGDPPLEFLPFDTSRERSSLALESPVIDYLDEIGQRHCVDVGHFQIFDVLSRFLGHTGNIGGTCVLWSPRPLNGASGLGRFFEPGAGGA